MSRVCFTARDLGYRLFPKALEEAGLTGKRHDDVFQDPITPDTAWLQRVASEGWIAKVYRPTPRELTFENKPGRVQQVHLPSPLR